MCMTRIMKNTLRKKGGAFGSLRSFLKNMKRERGHLVMVLPQAMFSVYRTVGNSFSVKRQKECYRKHFKRVYCT